MVRYDDGMAFVSDGNLEAVAVGRGVVRADGGESGYVRAPRTWTGLDSEHQHHGIICVNIDINVNAGGMKRPAEALSDQSIDVSAFKKPRLSCEALTPLRQVSPVFSSYEDSNEVTGTRDGGFSSQTTLPSGWKWSWNWDPIPKKDRYNWGSKPDDLVDGEHTPNNNNGPFLKKLSPDIRSRYEANKCVPFFKTLPAEIRLIIYEHVFELKTMHVSVRDCTHQEKGSWSDRTGLCREDEACEDDELTDWEDLADSRKFTHSICSIPQIEKEHYDSSQGLSPLSTEESSYAKRHSRCLSDIPTSKAVDSAIKDCSIEEDWRQPFQKAYEKEFPALARDHATSGMNLSLLLSCRQIHFEAALIPFKRTTFAFQDQKVLDRFMDNCLLVPQRNAIRQIQLDRGIGESAVGPFLADGEQHLLKGLRVLEVSFNVRALKLPDPSKPSSVSKFYIPEERNKPVVVRVTNMPVPETTREARKNFAEQWEKVLKERIRQRKPSEIR